MMKKIGEMCLLKVNNESKNVIKSLARNFIDSLLLVDPTQRLNVEQALNHSWITKVAPIATNKDLLPKVRKGFDARKTFRKAVDVIKAVNKLGSSVSFKSKSSRTSIESEGQRFSNMGGIPVSDNASQVSDSEKEMPRAVSTFHLKVPGADAEASLARKITK